MNFIRPEVRLWFRRYATLWVPCMTMVLGMYCIIAGGLLQWIGTAISIVSAMFIWTGWQRLRFRFGTNGPGIVQVIEGQITYFGPLTGGSVALSDLTSLALDRRGKPAHWVLRQPGQPDLHIPVTATGAQNLFNVFTGLPHMSTEKMLSELHNKTHDRITIWQNMTKSLH